VLRVIAALAKGYDERNREARHAANVMLFVPSESLDDQAAATLQSRLRFADDGIDIRRLRGVLDLVRDFSTTDSHEIRPDPELDDFALPIFSEVKNQDGQFRILFGAPIAFATRQPSLYCDTWKLEEWFAQQADISRSVQRQVADYFTSANCVRSFLSVPIISDGLPGVVNGGHPLGVINVHSNATNLLRTSELTSAGANAPLAQFTLQVRPLVLMLARLLLAHQSCTAAPHVAATSDAGTDPQKNGD
jgi:hypothetical protein